MPDFYINYDKLRRLHIIKFSVLIYILIFLLIVLIYFACHLSIERKIITYGIIENELLKIEINENLSDKIKNNNKLVFNNKEMNYKVTSFGPSKIVDNNIFVEINLVVDRYVYPNEVGKVTIYYDKQKIIDYILELFR